MGNATKPLNLARSGERLTVVSLDGGCGLNDHLSSIGLNIGKKIEVLNSSAVSGPVLVLAGEARIAVGCNMAKKVMVR